MISFASFGLPPRMKVLVGIYFLLAPALVVGSFIRTEINTYSKARFEEMIAGTAHRPFVSRPLVPMIIRTVSAAFPESMTRDLDEWAIRKFPRLGTEQPPVRFSHLLVASVLWYFSIVGFAATLWKLTNEFYDASDQTILAITGVSIAGIPTFFKYYSYLYDLPQLFLFTLCLFYLARKEWLWFIIFFTITTWNKETSIFLTFLFSIHFFRLLDRRMFLRLVGLQLALYGLIRTVIVLQTEGLPGSLVEFHLVRNLTLEPYTLAQFLAFLTLAILMAVDWSQKPAFLRNAFLLILPMASITFFLGYLDEYRDYYEVYAAVVLLSSHTILNRLLGLRFKVRESDGH